MMRWLVTAALAAVLIFPGTGTAEQAEPSVSILMYHHVSDSTPRSTSVNKEELRAHLQYLKDNNFNVIDIRDALAAVAGEKSLPDKAVVLTFDDAYQNIYTNGHPILAEFGYPYTLFVTTGPVSDTPGRYMSWDQIRSLHDEGVTIANHSTDHAHMPRRLNDESEEAWRQRMAENILQAEQTILDEVGVSYRLFAYPYGEYDNALAELVKELGFTGFGQHSGGFGPTTDQRTIPRFAAAGVFSSLDTLSTKMAALSFPLRDVQYDDTLLRNDMATPALELEFEVRDFRPNQLQCFIQSKLSSVEWLDNSRMRVQADEPLSFGRSRYNCTAPSISQAGRFYWYSIQWIRPREDGSWPG